MEAVGLTTAAVLGSSSVMSAGGEEGMAGITGDSKSYANISTTGDAGEIDKLTPAALPLRHYFKPLTLLKFLAFQRRPCIVSLLHPMRQ